MSKPGKVRVFQRPELTLDMVMASACLPTVFRAVEIDGVPYWDGGYMGNPVLFPFFTETETADIILIQINPIERKGAPDTTAEIMARIDEITFNAPLVAGVSRHRFRRAADRRRPPWRHALQDASAFM